MRLPGDPTVYRFILVGIVNTLFGTAIMFVFYNVFHLSYWISSASNYFFGSILSYFLNKSFTFRYGYKINPQVHNQHFGLLPVGLWHRQACHAADPLQL